MLKSPQPQPPKSPRHRAPSPLPVAFHASGQNTIPAEMILELTQSPRLSGLEKRKSSTDSGIKPTENRIEFEINPNESLSKTLCRYIETCHMAESRQGFYSVKSLAEKELALRTDICNQWIIPDSKLEKANQIVEKTNPMTEVMLKKTLIDNLLNFIDEKITEFHYMGIETQLSILEKLSQLFIANNEDEPIFIALPAHFESLEKFQKFFTKLFPNPILNDEIKFFYRGKKEKEGITNEKVISEIFFHIKNRVYSAQKETLEFQNRQIINLPKKIKKNEKTLAANKKKLKEKHLSEKDQNELQKEQQSLSEEIARFKNDLEEAQKGISELSPYLQKLENSLGINSPDKEKNLSKGSSVRKRSIKSQDNNAKKQEANQLGAPEVLSGHINFDTVLQKWLGFIPDLDAKNEIYNCFVDSIKKIKQNAFKVDDINCRIELPKELADKYLAELKKIVEEKFQFDINANEEFYLHPVLKERLQDAGCEIKQTIYSYYSNSNSDTLSLIKLDKANLTNAFTKLILEALRIAEIENGLDYSEISENIIAQQKKMLEQIFESVAQESNNPSNDQTETSSSSTSDSIVEPLSLRDITSSGSDEELTIKTKPKHKQGGLKGKFSTLKFFKSGKKSTGHKVENPLCSGSFGIFSKGATSTGTLTEKPPRKGVGRSDDAVIKSNASTPPPVPPRRKSLCHVALTPRPGQVEECTEQDSLESILLNIRGKRL